jgi:hypothetical protein
MMDFSFSHFPGKTTAYLTAPPSRTTTELCRYSTPLQICGLLTIFGNKGRQGFDDTSFRGLNLARLRVCSVGGNGRLNFSRPRWALLRRSGANRVLPVENMPHLSRKCVFETFNEEKSLNNAQVAVQAELVPEMFLGVIFWLSVVQCVLASSERSNDGGLDFRKLRPLVEAERIGASPVLISEFNF